jgi:hypothetical protein
MKANNFISLCQSLSGVGLDAMLDKSKIKVLVR